VTPLLLVCAGGALGSGGRYLAAVLAVRWLGPEFPHGTLLVNLAGSYVIGVVQELAGHRVLPEAARVFLAAGLLGGFTTYSAFSYESVRLAAGGAWPLAALYVGLTTVGCLALAALGVATGRWLAG
jgi:CrcB protein